MDHRIQLTGRANVLGGRVLVARGRGLILAAHHHGGRMAGKTDRWIGRVKLRVVTVVVRISTETCAVTLHAVVLSMG